MYVPKVQQPNPNGSILRTGYGYVGWLFDLGYVPLGVAAHAHWLPLVLTPGIFIIAGAPFFLRSQPRVAPDNSVSNLTS